MVIRRSDLTDEALQIGLWQSLCEAAGIEDEPFDDEQEIDIKRIEGWE